MGNEMFRGDRAGYNQLSGCGLKLLTEDELDELHRATLDVLENDGLRVTNGEAQEIFYSHGCQGDKETDTAKVPSYIVEDAIKSALSNVFIAGRNPK